MIYDIIGDIHGQAYKLIGLLTKLGYHYNGKFWQAPANHQAIFIGDLVDRGNQQLQTLQIVFGMIDHGSAQAVMGNHEYNAIGYATAHPDGGFCRQRNYRNTIQHQAFLDELPLGSSEHAYWIDRLYELPLWLQLPELNIVHACFDERAMQILSPLLTAKKQLTKQAMIATSTIHTPEFFALERVLKGIESPLPAGVTLTDGHGIVRNKTRVKWWVENWQNKPLVEVAQLGSSSTLDLPPNCPTTPTASEFYLQTKKPIFIGHYWLDGTPDLLSSQVVCTDYSAGKDGFLTAYRFDTNQSHLSAKNFIQYQHQPK